MKPSKNLSQKIFYVVTLVVFITQLVIPGSAYAQGIVNPTDVPATGAPATSPTDAATAVPSTNQPTSAPTLAPTDAPTTAPTDQPTTAPTDVPTSAPTDAPTAAADQLPTLSPTDPATLPAPDASPTSASSPTPTIDVTAVPTSTSVVVLDANGKAQPLATTASAIALATGGSFWCPAGQTPDPNGTGCSGSYTNLSSLLKDLGTTWGNSAGSIYIASGAVTEASPISFSSTNSYSLSFVGDFNGTGDSSFTVPFSIAWGGDLSFSNITWSGLSTNNLTSDGALVSVTSGGSLSMDNVSVTNSSGAGAKLTASGKVSITKSAFSNNKGVGLSVTNLSVAQSGPVAAAASDSISLDQVSADQNTSLGAYLQSNTGNISVTNSEFNSTTCSGTCSDGNGDGLQIISLFSGDITLTNINANQNGNDGVNLYTYNGNINVNNSVPNTASQYTFSGNQNDGVFANTVFGNINLANIEASSNGNNGAELTANTSGDLTAGNSFFDQNTNNGIYLYTLDGNTSLDGIDASQNGNSGAYILTENNGTVAVNNSSLNSNTNNGVEVYAGNTECIGNCDINLYNLTTDGNSGYGLYLNAYNGGNVNIDTVGAVQNGADGIRAYTASGDINLSNSSAYSNGLAGGNLYSDAGNISVTNSTFASNSFDGLDAGAGAGNITLNGVISGYFNRDANTSYGNGVDGANLWVQSGTISINNSEFSANTGNGLNLSTGDGTAAADTSVGLSTIRLNNVTAAGNGGDGFFFSTLTGTDPANIYINCSMLINNTGFGLDAANAGGSLHSSSTLTTGNNSGGPQNQVLPTTNTFFTHGTCAPQAKKSYQYSPAAGNGISQLFACDQFFGIVLQMPDGDFVAVPCSGRGNSTSISGDTVAIGSLPLLPTKGTTLSALIFSLDKSTQVGKALVSFKVAPGVTSTNGYSILHFTGTGWEDAGQVVLVDGGSIQAGVSETGMYVLVKQ